MRADSSAPGYREIDTSLQVVAFGNAHLAQPRSSSGIKERIFSDLLPATVGIRKELDSEDPLDSKTLSGISNVFEIICEVKRKEKYLVETMLQANGRVLWRRFPCFCASCLENQWDLCLVKDIVGRAKIVKLG